MKSAKTHRNPLLDCHESLFVKEQILESSQRTFSIDRATALEHITVTAKVVTRRTGPKFESRNKGHDFNFRCSLTSVGLAEQLARHLTHFVGFCAAFCGEKAFLKIVLVTNRSSTGTAPAYLCAHIALGFVGFRRRCRTMGVPTRALGAFRTFANIATLFVFAFEYASLRAARAFTGRAESAGTTSAWL